MDPESPEIRGLEKRIKDLRRRMYAVAEERGIKDPRVRDLGRKIDSNIVEYIALIKECERQAPGA